MHSSINLHQSVNQSISRSTNHVDRNRPSMTHIYRNHDYTLTEGSDWNPSSGIESEDLLFTFRWASFPHCWEQQIRTWKVLVKAIHFLLKAIQHQIWPREKLVSKSRRSNVTAKRKGQMMCQRLPATNANPRHGGPEIVLLRPHTHLSMCTLYCKYCIHLYT